MSFSFLSEAEQSYEPVEISYFDQERTEIADLLDHDHIEQGRHLLADIQKRIGPNEPKQEGMASTDDLLESGRSVAPQFDKMTKEIALATGGEPVLVDLKSRKRIEKKVGGEYDGDYNSIRDVVRSSIIFDSLEDLYKGVEKVHGLARIRYIKDRFYKPATSHYRDLKFNLELPGPDGQMVITELQFHLRGMLESKKHESRVYEKRRILEAEYKALPDDVDPQVKKALETKISYLQQESQDIYDRVWESYTEPFAIAA